MLRKMMIILITTAAAGAVTLPTDVSARGGHGGWRGGSHFHGFRGGFGYRAFGYPYYAGVYGSSCWRVQATPYGWRRVWVCGGNGYQYY
jgi:hypothetical protein